jgi:hypothetical protein
MCRGRKGCVMHRTVYLPRGRVVDLEYWLRRCEGFRVESPEGRVGVVEELRFASRPDRPDALAVDTGLVRDRLVIIPVEEVATIDPRATRVVLRCAPAAAGLQRRLIRRLFRPAARLLRLTPERAPVNAAADRAGSAAMHRSGGRLPAGGDAGQGAERALAAQILGEARALLAQGWCQSAQALDADRNPVEPWSRAARHWSIDGALAAIRHERWRAGQLDEPVRGGFERAVLALQATLGVVAAWNDAPARTDTEVLAALERAFELVRDAR